MNVAITGANGLVGSSIINELEGDRFSFTKIDLPDIDAFDYEALRRATIGADALIHLAWADLIPHVRQNTRDERNLIMVNNAYEAAVANGIKRVIMGSSNQAHGYEIRDTDGKIRVGLEDLPELEYGWEKLDMEARGREYAKQHGLEVICLRIGNVNAEDAPKSTDDGRPQRWLSKRDLGQLVSRCLTAPTVPGNFQIVYGVSDGPVYDWSNPFGYVPVDSAD